MKLLSCFLTFFAGYSLVACARLESPLPTLTPSPTTDPLPPTETVTPSVTPTETPAPTDETGSSLVRLTDPPILVASPSPNGSQIVVATSVGIEIYDTQSLTLMWQAPLPGNYSGILAWTDNDTIVVSRLTLNEAAPGGAAEETPTAAIFHVDVRSQSVIMLHDDVVLRRPGDVAVTSNRGTHFLELPRPRAEVVNIDDGTVETFTADNVLAEGDSLSVMVDGQWSPDDSRLAVSAKTDEGRDLLLIWRTADQSLLQAVFLSGPGPKEPVTTAGQLAFGPDNDQLALFREGILTVYSISEGMVIWETSIEDAVAANDIIWLNEHIIVDSEGTLYSVDAATGSLTTVSDRQYPVTRTGREIITGLVPLEAALVGSIPLVRFTQQHLSIMNPESLSVEHELVRFSNSDVVVGPHGAQSVAFVTDNAVQVMNYRTGDITATISMGGTVAWDANGDTLAVLQDGTLLLHPLQENENAETYSLDASTIHRLVDEALALVEVPDDPSGSNGSTGLELIDLNTISTVWRYALEAKPIIIVPSPDSSHVAILQPVSARREKVVVVNISTGSVTLETDGGDYSPQSLAWSEDSSQIVLASITGEFAVYELGAGITDLIPIPTDPAAPVRIHDVLWVEQESLYYLEPLQPPQVWHQPTAFEEAASLISQLPGSYQGVALLDAQTVLVRDSYQLFYVWSLN